MAAPQLAVPAFDPAVHNPVGWPRLPLPLALVIAVVTRALSGTAIAARGELVAKMDDDALYDRRHVWDLVLAHQYSGAALVGKAAETVYLADADATLRRRVGNRERYDGGIAGGTLLLCRDDLGRAGGWPLLPVGEDRALIARVHRIGAVYRTHGFVLVRHGRRHAWEPGSDRFHAHADLVRPGWHPQLADIDDEPRFEP